MIFFCLWICNFSWWWIFFLMPRFSHFLYFSLLFGHGWSIAAILRTKNWYFSIIVNSREKKLWYFDLEFIWMLSFDVGIIFFRFFFNLAQFWPSPDFLICIFYAWSSPQRDSGHLRPRKPPLSYLVKNTQLFSPVFFSNFELRIPEKQSLDCCFIRISF